MENVMEIYEQWFKANGIIYHIDKDSDLVFKYQTCSFYIINPKSDKQYLNIVLPSIWSIDSDEERADALKVANDLNMNRKALKVFVGPESVHLTVEMFIDNTPDVEDFMERLLDILVGGRMLFYQKMHELR